MKTILVFGGVAIALVVGGVWLTSALQESDPDVISRNGLHWHPTLEIYVRGEKLEIPQNIGIGGVHEPVHTHDDLPILHLEFSGIVRAEDIMLGKFFENWGTDILSFGKSMRMTVNGVDNTEYERYIMKDKDKIELHYD